MRATSRLGARLERNLHAYATAATAGGIGILALVPVAEGKVVYTPTQVHIGVGDAYPLDLNNDGVGEVVIWDSVYCSEGCIAYMSIRRQRSGDGSVELSAHDTRFAAALRQGAQVGPKKKFLYYFVGMAAKDTTATSGGRFSSGPWRNVKDRYLGLKFEINGETHYGWARMSVEMKQFSIVGTLTGYAYETIADKAIIAGNRGSTTGQGPEAEPLSLGHLALGAAGTRPQHRGVESSH